jgi:hypothetical protein
MNRQVVKFRHKLKKTLDRSIRGPGSSRVGSGRVGSAEASRVSDRSAAREREDVVTGGLDSNPFAQFVVVGIACGCGSDSYGSRSM